MIRMDSPTDPRLTLRSPEPYLLEGRMRIIVQLSEDERGYNGYELRRALDALCVAIHPNGGQRHRHRCGNEARSNHSPQKGGHTKSTGGT